MILSILRGAFVLLATSVAALYVISWQRELADNNQQVTFGTIVLMLVLSLGVAAVVVAVDMFTRRKKLAAVSGIFLGLIAGLLAAYALSFVVDLVGVLFAPPGSGNPLHENPARVSFFELLEGVKVVIGLITCYLGISLVIQTKDDFRFVIPYVEFAKQIRGNRPTILDTSVIVDGRIVDIVETRLLQGTLVVPKFVLNELQTIADSADKLRRARGRRGLDVLQRLRNNEFVEVHIDETDPEGAAVDAKLISLAQENQGRVMTNDYNLNKIATLRGVDVINLNDLAKALRPVVLPGEHMRVRVVKPGETPHQGVGYLDDGTMVVVEGGRAHLNEEVDLTVTSTLQTSAGRMIFGRFESAAGGEGTEAPPPGEQREQAAAVPTEAGNSGEPSADGARGPGAPPATRPPRRIGGGGLGGGRNPRRTR